MTAVTLEGELRGGEGLQKKSQLPDQTKHKTEGTFHDIMQFGLSF